MKQYINGYYIQDEKDVPSNKELSPKLLENFFDYSEKRLRERINNYDIILNEFESLALSIRQSNLIINENKNNLLSINSLIKESSKHIEKNKMTQSLSFISSKEDLENFLKRGMSLYNMKNSDEREQWKINGYYEALSFIMTNDVSITIKNIDDIHSKFEEQGIREDDKIMRIVLLNPPVVLVSNPNGIVVRDYLNRWIESLNKYCDWNLNGKNLLIIFVAMYDFLAIHPFKNGNGRMSRLLIIWFLLKLGVKFVNYSSIEGYIYLNRMTYEFASNHSMVDWWLDNSPIQKSFFDFYKDLIIKCSDNTKNIIALLNTHPKASDVINALKHISLEFTIQELAQIVNISIEELREIMMSLFKCQIVAINNNDKNKFFKYGGIYANS